METAINQSLVDLIVKACGPRSLSKYGRDVAISTAHLSRIKQGKSTPTRSLCMKMAADDYVKLIGLSADDFLEAAGYRTETSENTETADDEVSIQNTIALGVISKYLMDKGYTYQMLPKDQIEEADFTFSIKDKGNNKVRWNFVCDFSDQTKDSQGRSVAYYYNYGRICSFRYKANMMNTVLIGNEELYDELIRGIDPKVVFANVSIAYVDTEKMTIMKEECYGPGVGSMQLI